MTAYEEKNNVLTPGNNVTQIVEVFPPQTPQNIDSNPVFQKTVRITAPAASGVNVDCYVRARILYSNSDIGNAVTLSGKDASWVKAADGYFYYVKKVRAGETTAPLFTSVSIDSSRISDRRRKYIRDFSISIYEESVQAGNYAAYTAAWQEFLHRS